MLAEREPRWRYSATKRLFFVGNVAHFPNHQAVEWLATRFATQLEKRDGDARIVIIGAEKEKVPRDWLRPNVDYLGYASKEDVQDRFIGSDLFIVPIANDFGSKIKVLECMAYGAPLISTEGGLSGIPFSDLVPKFSLDDPHGAAQLACDLIEEGTRLDDLGRKLASEMRATRESGEVAWHRLIDRTISRSKRRQNGGRRSRILAALRRQFRRSSSSTEVCQEIGVSEVSGIIVTGVYAVEQHKGLPLRWTSGEAEIIVPLDPLMLPTRLFVKLWNITPEGGTNFRILANDVELHSGRLVRNWRFGHDKAFANEFKLPDLANQGCLLVRIESSVGNFEGSERALGVAIESITIC